MQQPYFKAIYRDGTVLRQPFDDANQPYNGTMDTKQVAQYWIINEADDIHHGVDVERRLFVINGAIVHSDLPTGAYQLISFKRVQQVSNRDRVVFYCFGLHGNIDGKNHKRVVFLNPDGTFTFASTT